MVCFLLAEFEEKTAPVSQPLQPLQPLQPSPLHLLGGLLLKDLPLTVLQLVAYGYLALISSFADPLILNP